MVNANNKKTKDSGYETETVTLGSEDLLRTQMPIPREKYRAGIVGFIFSMSAYVMVLVSLFLFSYTSLVMSVVGTVLSIVQLKRHKTRLGVSGLVMGLLGIVMFVLLVVFIDELRQMLA